VHWPHGRLPGLRSLGQRFPPLPTRLDRLADELGLGLSDEKRQLSSQRVTYTGMVVDTYRRTISIPHWQDKKLRLAQCLEEFFGLRECSVHDLASLRGRVQHYSACLPYVRPFVALFSSVLGTEGELDSDSTISLPPAISEAAVFIRGVLEDHAFSGRPDSDDMRHQVRREALAGVLAFNAAALELDLSDAVVILSNDAAGALAAFKKGSFASTFLQQCSMRSCLAQRQARCQVLTLHAPGRVLVKEGVDNHSRSAALEVAGPVSSRLVRQRALALAASCGWTLTVDAFASASNSLLPRFFA
jgi:hypothetical protein